VKLQRLSPNNPGWKIHGIRRKYSKQGGNPPTSITRKLKHFGEIFPDFPKFSEILFGGFMEGISREGILQQEILKRGYLESLGNYPDIPRFPEIPVGAFPESGRNKRGGIPASVILIKSGNLEKVSGNL
jgi:hypothetical protein